jgi:Tfp pilus assembly protein PilP
MRALAFSLVMVLAAPVAALAQGDAAMAAARAATGSQVGKAPASKSAAPAPAPSAPAPSKAPEATAATVAPSAESGSAALDARGFTYNPEGRRDPFVNLLKRGTGVDTASSANLRPTGVKGLAANEVVLKGTMASRGAFVAILQGADTRTYVVHAGEQLYDGTIRSITADAMVILQQVSDPLSKETKREVRKVLRQTEEAR